MATTENKPVSGQSAIKASVRQSRKVPVGEPAENTGLCCSVASAVVCAGFGNGATHRMNYDTPSLAGSCRGTLRAP